MFVFNWFKNVLASLGLFKKTAKILFLGLDNSGKSVLLDRLKESNFTIHPPTIYTHVEKLTIDNMNFEAYDLGGLDFCKKTWKTHFQATHGVVYLVDAADTLRFEESKKELDKLLVAPELAKVPFVILGNKMDKKEAVQEEDLRFALGLAKKGISSTEKINEIDGRPIEVFMCSLANKTGYIDGIRWLSKFIKL